MSQAPIASAATSRTPDPASVTAPPAAPATALSAPREGGGAFGWLLLVLVIGLLGRFLLALRPGFTDDLTLFEDWLRGLGQHGLGEFFNHSNANYPPLHILALRAQAWLMERAGVDLAATGSSDLIRFWLRAPACVADVLIALLLFVEGGRWWGRRAGLAAAAIYFLNPVSPYISAYWGQVDSIHSLFVLAAVAALNRGRPVGAGAAIALAMLQKLQSIAFLPLVWFDVYRYRRWTGLVGCLIGMGLAASVVLAPFLAAGSARTALERGYVRVLGQYPRLSINAFNLWHIGDHPRIGDHNPPRVLIRAAGRNLPPIHPDGSPKVDTGVPENAAWYLGLTWRRIGSVLFVLFTASVLSLYARRHLPEHRALAAGALGLAFFLFPTEMHERYAYPVIAVLALWAVTGPWRERIYWAFCVLFLLNLAAILPIEPIASVIGVGLLGVFAVMMAGLRLPAAAPAALSAGPPPAWPGAAPPPAPPPSRLVTWFCRATFVAWVVVLNTACVLVYLGSTAPWPREQGAIYVTELEPVSVSQNFGNPAADAEVEGGPLRLADHFYLRGLGSHARSRIVYKVPEGYTRFVGRVGVHRLFEGRARVAVLVDDQVALKSDSLTANDPPIDLDVDVSSASTITLWVDPDGINKGDHVDWVDVRFVR